MPTSYAPAKQQERTSRNNTFPITTATKAPTVSTQPAKGPPPDLIDFFESIDSNQQPMAQQAVATQGYNQGFPQQQYQPSHNGHNPFLQQPIDIPWQPQHSLQQVEQPQQFQEQPQSQPHQSQQFQQQQTQPIQNQFTGAGFGGYTSLPHSGQPQSYGVQSPMSVEPQTSTSIYDQPPQSLQSQQTSTNPFRQSSMPTGFGSNSLTPTMHDPNRQSTNPFAKGHVQSTGAAFAGSDVFGSTTSASPTQNQHQEFPSNSAHYTGATSPPQEAVQSGSPAPLQPQRTGTNPFAKNRSPPPSAAPLVANATGSTNPFRQSAFVNQQTGQGWQRSDQGIFSNLQTIPVFPRPGQN